MCHLQTCHSCCCPEVQYDQVRLLGVGKSTINESIVCTASEKEDVMCCSTFFFWIPGTQVDLSNFWRNNYHGDALLWVEWVSSSSFWLRRNLIHNVEYTVPGISDVFFGYFSEQKKKNTKIWKKNPKRIRYESSLIRQQLCKGEEPRNG